MEFIVTYLVIGFLTVFGWNTGQRVWDKYIEPEIQQEKTADVTNDKKSK
jgi:hypothetical protein